jgi:FkbM family methyltransferase
MTLLMVTIKHALKKSIRSAGWNVARYNVQTSPSLALCGMLAANGITTVLDVGAHEGGFALSLREAGYKGRIVSFEPLRATHEKLSQNARHDPNWTVADRMAIGDHDGSVVIHISGNSGASSSALRMLDTHVKSDPNSAYVGAEEVPLHKLDTIFQRFVTGSGNTFLKMDVQGFEKSVLDGAAAVLDRVQGIHTELSLVLLYEGQPLIEEMYSRLTKSGFCLWSVVPGFTDATTGRLLQLDGIFFRDEPLTGRSEP